MPQHFKQMQHGRNEARNLLNQRLTREEMGDEAYEKMIASNDDRSFKIFGMVFIAGFAAVILGVALLGY